MLPRGRRKVVRYLSEQIELTSILYFQAQIVTVWRYWNVGFCFSPHSSIIQLFHSAELTVVSSIRSCGQVICKQNPFKSWLGPFWLVQLHSFKPFCPVLFLDCPSSKFPCKSYTIKHGPLNIPNLGLSQARSECRIDSTTLEHNESSLMGYTRRDEN